MRNIICLFGLLSLAACTTGPSLQSRMAAYTGASAETLVQKLGVPDKQITLNGTQYLAYDEHHTQITPGISAFGGFGGFYGPFYGGPVLDTGIAPTITDDRCETTFALQNDKVVSFTFRGNDCS